MNQRRVLDHPLFEFAAAMLAALALTWIAFGPGLGARFVSDDVNAIVENEWVVGDFDPSGIVRNFSWWGRGRADSVGYRPAATLSFAANRLVSGAEPYGFRVINYVLNALCAGLLFALARSLGLGREACGAAALLFAVLPIHSEAVIWIVGRAELGAAAGFLLGALACLRYRRSGSVWLAVAAAAIAIGMAFKENAVTVLAAPAIYLVTLRRDGVPWRRDATAFAALATGALGYALLRSAANGPALAREAGSLLDNPLSVVDSGTRLLGALAVLGRYVALTFWPSSLSIDYSFDALGIGPGFRANADSIVAVAFLAAAALVVVRGPGRRDIAAAGLLLAAASYSIVSNTVFVLGTILGERLFYLPSAGLCIALAALAEPLLASGRNRKRLAVSATVIFVLAGAAVATSRHRAAEWMTPVTLFRAAATAVPRSARAHMELASAYANDGRVEDATRHFATALAIKPDYAAAAYNQGNMFARAGRYEEAVAAYRSAIAIDPRFTRAWHNLALTERLRGRTDAWLEAMKAAVESSPESSLLQSELAEALLAAGRYAEAVSAYDALVASDRAVAAAYFNRGVARHHLGGCAEAVQDYRLATTAPGAPREAFVAAAGCLRELGRSEEAVAVEEAAKVANRGTRR